MINEHENIIFDQELPISASDAKEILESFLRHELDNIKILWDIDLEGVKNIVIVYKENVREPENKIFMGFVEINPVSFLDDKKTRIRVVSLREDAPVWWLNFAQLLQTKAIIPDFPANVVTGISRELTADITYKYDNQKIEIPSKPESVGLLRRPEKPKKGSSLDTWFKYYHDCKDGGFKCTFEDIAKETDYDAGYLRQLHMHYQAENKDLTESNKN
jgi:hypothetical protein